MSRAGEGDEVSEYDTTFQIRISISKSRLAVRDQEEERATAGDGRG